jgi:hypothetical protein
MISRAPGVPRANASTSFVAWSNVTLGGSGGLVRKEKEK